jgi:hypothetical protein
MSTRDFTVPEGAVRTIAFENSKETGGEIRYLRPRTSIALRTLLGVASAPVELENKEKFEVVERSEDLIQLATSRNGLVRDFSVSYLKAVIASLPDKREIPDRVEISRRARSIAPCGCHGKPEAPQTAARTSDSAVFGRLVEKYVVAVPDWIRALHVYVAAIAFRDIVVAPQATLMIANTVHYLIARNFYIYPNGRVIQQAPSLSVSLSGELAGKANLKIPLVHWSATALDQLYKT